MLSPFFRSLPLAEHGLRWIHPPASVAHPLDDEPAVLLRRSLRETASELGEDARAYERLFAPFLREPHGLLADLLGPLRIPRHPILHGALRPAGPAARDDAAFRARFRGPAGARAARRLRGAFDPAARAAAHRGGRDDLRPHRARRGLAGRRGRLAGDRATRSPRTCAQLGGRIETGRHVRSLADLPPARVVLFDTSPAQLADIGEPILPAGYVRRLRRYRYGPGVFKLDWALDGPIPWRDPRCLEASTVHLGGTLEEIAAAEAAVWRGEHPERPVRARRPAEPVRSDAARRPASTPATPTATCRRARPSI